MSFREKLDDAIGSIEDKISSIGQRSNKTEQRLLEKNEKRIDKYEERKDRMGNSMSKAMDKAGGFFDKLKDSAEERKARFDLKRSNKK